MALEIKHYIACINCMLCPQKKKLKNLTLHSHHTSTPSAAMSLKPFQKVCGMKTDILSISEVLLPSRPVLVSALVAPMAEALSLGPRSRNSAVLAGPGVLPTGRSECERKAIQSHQHPWWRHSCNCNSSWPSAVFCDTAFVMSNMNHIQGKQAAVLRDNTPRVLRTRGTHRVISTTCWCGRRA